MTMAEKAATAARTIPKGKTTIHGAFKMRSRPPAIMRPKDGFGGGTPTPRNDKDDSIKRPIRKAKLKPTGDSAIARRRVSRNRLEDAPPPRTDS